MNNGKIIHNLSLTDGNSKEDIVEDSVSNTNFAVHDVKEFENFFELVLNDSITVKVLSRFQILKQLHHIQPKLLLIPLPIFEIRWTEEY